MLLPPLKDVIHRHGLMAKKSLGQHFLLDGNITAKVARQAGALAGVHVIEIGPGPGGLTRALLDSEAASVTAIERDARCIAALQELQPAYGERFRLIEADAMTVDVEALCPAPRAIIANLPYNIGTPLLIGWLKAVHAGGPEAIASLTLMFQKEVADRITAAPGSKDYGRLAVMTQWLCDAWHCFDLPPTAFIPPPKVTSTVVHIVPRAQRPTLPFASMERLLQAAFGQRRKMLKSALKALLPDAEALLNEAGIAPTERAENVPVDAFVRLTGLWQAGSASAD